MRVKFLTSHNYSINGYEVIHSEKGDVAELPEDLADAFITQKIAKKADDKADAKALKDVFLAMKYHRRRP